MSEYSSMLDDQWVDQDAMIAEQWQGDAPTNDVPNVSPTGEIYGPPSTQTTKDGQSIYYGADGAAVGYDNNGTYQNYFNSDGSAAVTTNDYDPSAWDQFTSFMREIFGSTPDASGRQQQSLAASVVLGAAQSALKLLSDGNAQKAASNLENQKSGNRIKERTEEENRIRAAASAMPKQALRGGRTVTKPVGLLSR